MALWFPSGAQTEMSISMFLIRVSMLWMWWQCAMHTCHSKISYSDSMALCMTQLFLMPVICKYIWRVEEAGMGGFWENWLASVSAQSLLHHHHCNCCLAQHVHLWQHCTTSKCRGSTPASRHGCGSMGSDCWWKCSWFCSERSTDKRCIQLKLMWYEWLMW